jgi:hypothetical protein
MALTDVVYQGEIIWKRKSNLTIKDKEWWRDVFCKRFPLRGKIDMIDFERFLLDEFELQSDLKYTNCIVGVVYNKPSTLCKCTDVEDVIHRRAKAFCFDGMLHVTYLDMFKGEFPAFNTKDRETYCPVAYLKSRELESQKLESRELSRNKQKTATNANRSSMYLAHTRLLCVAHYQDKKKQLYNSNTIQKRLRR